MTPTPADEGGARPRPALSSAMKFVVTIGVMSFLVDFTYEGSRSIVGQYLGLLGAGALAIAIAIAARRDARA